MPENIQSTDDYISLSSIKKMFLDIIRFLLKVFEFIITSIQHKLGLFLICCCTGLIAGYIYYWQSPRYFESEMIVTHNDLSRKAYYEVISNLDELLASQSYSSFTAQLHISGNVGNRIISLETVGINNETLSQDTSTKVGMPFKIVAKTKDNTSLPVLQDAILKYLNNNPYLKLTKEGQKKIYLEKLQFIERELQKLDSLKQSYNTSLGSLRLPATFYNNALNPADLYVHSLHLATQRENILKWLNNESEAILLIDGFKTPANPKIVSLKVSLLTGFLIGALTGVIAAFLFGITRIIK